MEKHHNAKAHTAEHIFARALQNMLGSESIQVLKVEHLGDVNKVYIRCKGLCMDDVHKAMLTVNRIIDENRSVIEHTFPSLDEAKDRFPELRAYYARISGMVRVVEIDGYDYSACTREHVSSTGECGLFIVKSVSRERDVSRVEYLVDDLAKQYAIGSVTRLASIAGMLKANINTVEVTLENILEELDNLRDAIRKLTEDAVDALSAVRVNDLNLYYGYFNMLDDGTLLKKAGAMVKDNTSTKLVIFLNKKKDRSNVIIASNHPRLDCSRLLKDMLARYGGKGGGKAEFATGYINNVDGDRVKQEVIESIERALMAE
ncbi:MAG: DHHA1 domain-containing protein [Candidatus Nitrosocaldus sp.]